VAVGENGIILQSDPFTELRLTALNYPSAAGFQMTLVGEAGRRYTLQVSSDLNPTNWIDLSIFTSTQSTMLLADTNASDFNQRFYRVLSP
jgi:hypothetical protein